MATSRLLSLSTGIAHGARDWLGRPTTHRTRCAVPRVFALLFATAHALGVFARKGCHRLVLPGFDYHAPRTSLVCTWRSDVTGFKRRPRHLGPTASHSRRVPGVDAAYDHFGIVLLVSHVRNAIRRFCVVCGLGLWLGHLRGPANSRSRHVLDARLNVPHARRSAVVGVRTGR